jgi:hypothetical protein
VGKGNEKYTVEIADRIVALYEATQLFDDACATSGISPRTGQYWRAKGRRSRTGKYHDFEMKCRVASGEHIIPVVNLLRTYALGGVIRQPKRQRYVDNHGVWRELNAVELDENGQPVYELIAVQPSEKAAMFLAERMRPETFGDQKKIQIVDETERRNAMIEAAMFERVNRIFPVVETEAKQIEDKSNDDNE